jgi:hypothetical protein
LNSFDEGLRLQKMKAPANKNPLCCLSRLPAASADSAAVFCWGAPPTTPQSSGMAHGHQHPALRGGHCSATLLSDFERPGACDPRERPRRVRRLARHIRDGGPFFAPPARTPAHPAMKRCRRRHCSRVPSTLLSVRRPGAQSPSCYPSRPRTQPASASAAGLSLPPSRTQAAPGSRAPGMELRRGGSPLCDAVAAKELARMLFVRPRRFLSVSHADLAGLT